MPRQKLYATRAQQQAAYRQRTKRAQAQMLAQKGLPPTPAIPTIPGKARWRAALLQAHALLEQTAQEIHDYHDDRSQQWQESDAAQDLLGYVDALQDIGDQLEDLKELP